MHDGFPLPDLGDRLTSGFWFAAERHELAIPQCRRCRRWVWYPEAACPWCSQPGPEWTEVTGRATLFTWTEVRRALLPEYAEMVPYISAIVTLDEDPSLRVVTRVVDAEVGDLVRDMPMVVTFREISFAGSPLRRVAPLFAPTAGDASQKEQSSRASV